MLVGIVVNNAIVLIDKVNRCAGGAWPKKRGRDPAGHICGCARSS
jgi:hypothetical protein